MTSITSLDGEVIALILAALRRPEDLAQADMTCTIFNVCTIVALRLRAAQRAEQLSELLPSGFSSWKEKLWFVERRAAAHGATLSINQSHVAAVHADRIYTWGTEYVSPCGREVPSMLGQGIRNTKGHIFENDVHQPTAVPGVKGAASVSCGREHTLIATTDGEVFAFGNGEWGACGEGPGRPRHGRFPPTAEPAYLRNKLVMSDTGTFGKMKDGYWPCDALYSIVHDCPTASCAECRDCKHPSMAIDNDMTMADIYDENRGHPDGPWGMCAPAFLLPLPRLVPMPVKVLKVAAGSLHSLAMGEDGHVYAFGCAYDGRLGLGPLSSPPIHMVTPTKLTLGALASGARVVDISAGPTRSLAVRADGSVVGWGGTDPALLGLGKMQTCAEAPRTRRSAALMRAGGSRDVAPFSTPMAIQLPAGVKIEQASVGSLHALLVSTNGAAYSFGKGHGGALGHGEDESDKDVPTNILALAGVSVAVAAAGCVHSLVASVDGAVYEFGVEDGLKTDDWSEDEDEEAPPDHPRGLPQLIGERATFGWSSSRTDEPFLHNVKATGIYVSIYIKAPRLSRKVALPATVTLYLSHLLQPTPYLPRRHPTSTPLPGRDRVRPRDDCTAHGHWHRQLRRPRERYLPRVDPRMADYRDGGRGREAH